uniref:Uncharacterized protein n=1 Tax=Rhizophora mucronata TaxID=61149 RepID=A0A2P2P287_RHIMU
MICFESFLIQSKGSRISGMQLPQKFHGLYESMKIDGTLKCL